MSREESTNTLTLKKTMKRKRKNSILIKWFSWKIKRNSKKTTRNLWKILSLQKIKNNHKFPQIQKPNPPTIKKFSAKKLKNNIKKIRMRTKIRMKQIKMTKKTMRKKLRKSLRKKTRKNHKNSLMKRYWIHNWANFTNWSETFTHKTIQSSSCPCALHTTQ